MGMVGWIRGLVATDGVARGRSATFVWARIFARRVSSVGGERRLRRGDVMGRHSAALTGGRVARIGALILGSLALAHCSVADKFGKDSKHSPKVIEDGEPVPKGGGAYRVGKPYMVAGRMYVPEENRRYRSEGLASWYGQDFHGRLTANGEIFDMASVSAAHPTLPMPSYVRVTNLANRRSLIVRVNDRGPYHANREIDVSMRAAQLLDFHKNGTARVRVEYVGPAALEGSDDRKLVATLREGTPAPAPSAVMVASARPFLPQAANAPTPPERPFDLGQPSSGGLFASARRPQGPAAPAALPGVVYADAAPPRAPQLRSSLGNSPASPTPTSAYAPAYLGTQAVSSGRGLY
jgi:rare lipoprotein A